jgi:hypothetical protein
MNDTAKKAYLVSLKHKLKKHLQLQSASTNQIDRRWLNGFMALGFHSGLINLSELKLEYMRSHRNAYGERMSEAQEQQTERRLTKLCQMDCRLIILHLIDLGLILFKGSNLSDALNW